MSQSSLIEAVVLTTSGNIRHFSYALVSILSNRGGGSDLMHISIKDVHNNYVSILSNRGGGSDQTSKSTGRYLAVVSILSNRGGGSD